MSPRTALVTGAGSGIGRATAELLLEDGQRVVGVDVQRRSLGWLDGHADALGVEADVSTEEGNRAMVDAALSHFGALDTLVLNAGIVHIGPFDRLDLETIDRVLAVNLRGSLLGLRAALPALERAPQPAVVTVASISGLAGEPAMTLYAASKGGVVNLTRSAAVELGPRGIRVNCVCPGPTMTAMARPLLEAGSRVAEVVRGNVPLKRVAEPGEIAAVIVFLASPAASFVHGAIVPVDGGLMANVGQYPPPAPPLAQVAA